MNRYTRRNLVDIQMSFQCSLVREVKYLRHVSLAPRPCAVSKVQAHLFSEGTKRLLNEICNAVLPVGYIRHVLYYAVREDNRAFTISLPLANIQTSNRA